MEAADDAGRTPGFLIHDPLRNSYFRISRLAGQALSCWRAGCARALIAQLAERHGVHATGEDIAELVQFITANQLVRAGPGDWERLAGRRERGLLVKALHGYLFFRVPLVRPQRFLHAALPWVSWLGGRFGISLLLVISLLGLYLTSRQWDVFKATFMGFLTLQGLALYALTLVFVKAAHELGHAFIATRFGCRVPVMGVAFLVMMPMLYTDVTDAWKLRSRRQRLLIDAGGMLVELGIAGVALFLWAFLPEGPGRAMAFFVATTSLASTLLINASPFMRFDGYHILADALRMHNLAPRAFDLALTRLRNGLFGLRLPDPEVHTRRMRGVLMVYAWATILYRAVVFSGIALLVYHAFPKVLGLILGGIEVSWFLVMPVVREVRRWWEMRQTILKEGKPWRPVMVLAVLGVVLFAPVWGSLRLPALLTAARQMDVYAPEAGQVLAVHAHAGQRVRKGQVLAELRSRELEQEERKTIESLRLVELRLRRLAADARDLSEHGILKKRQAALREKLAGLARRRAQLTLRAQFDGVVSRVMEGLKAGLWVNESQLLARVVSARARVASALVDEEDAGRLSAGAAGWFIPDDPELPRMAMRLVDIGAVRKRGRDLVYLSSVHGGPAPSERDRDGRIQMRKGMFPALFVPAAEDTEPACRRACTGRMVVEAQRQSLAGRMARRAVAVLLRESGF